MKNNDKNIVLFDFDGVIVDSFRAAFNTRKELDPDLLEDEYRSMFSGNINKSVEKRLETRGTNSTKKDFFELYVPRFLASPIFPGMREAVRSLAEKYTLAVISSTISSPIKEYLIKHDLAAYFSDILGNDVHRSKQVKIGMVLERHGLSSQNSIFISDTLGDAYEAKAAGVQTIGVTWGYQSKDSLIKEAFFAIVETPKQLVESVEGYFSSK